MTAAARRGASRAWPERALASAVYAGIGLALLTPLAWAPWTFHPFTVGKAVYARSVIAATFALWALLAFARPRWRPPPTAILWALLGGLAASAASAAFGVSPQRSLWSTYTRMEGLVDAAHWIAFAVVLMAMMRTPGAWKRLFQVHLCVGLAVALVAAAREFFPEAAILGLGPEGRPHRVSATTDNPTFLGAYLQAIALLAAGFLARSWRAAGSAGKAGARTKAKAGRRARKRRRRPATGKLRAARVFWAATVACALYGIALTGSMGALAGLGAGAGAAALAHAWLADSRRIRRLALGSLAAVAAVFAALALTASLRAARAPDGEAPRPAFDSILLERATSTERVGNTLRGRLRNWEAGLRGFADRPLLGWGTSNYFVASGRHRPRPEGRALIADHAHNMVVEEAATRGLAGLAAYFALWGLTAAAILRRVRIAEPREQTLVIFAGAALAGWFVQSQTLFYSPSSWLQHMLLAAFAAHLEATAPGDARTGRLGAAVAAAWGALRRRAARWSPGAPLAAAARAAAALGALALAGASLASNRAILAADAAVYRAEHRGPFLEEMERSIDSFEPLANSTRIILFNNVAVNWPVLTEHQPAEARRLRRWMGEEAEAALASEPRSWVLHHALTRLYRAFAETHPEDAEPARRHFDRSLELAPNLDPLEAPVSRSGRR